MILSSLNVIGYYNLFSIKKSVCNNYKITRAKLCLLFYAILLETLWFDNGRVHENVTEK